MHAAQEEGGLPGMLTWGGMRTVAMPSATGFTAVIGGGSGLSVRDGTAG
jgi:hypothetical protein